MARFVVGANIPSRLPTLTTPCSIRLPLSTLGSGASPGTLNAANGLTLDFGGNVTGFGTISTPNTLAKPLINNGHITGTSAATTDHASRLRQRRRHVRQRELHRHLLPRPLADDPDRRQHRPFAIRARSSWNSAARPPAAATTRFNRPARSTFDGTLQVSLINGFTPTAGQSFNLFDWHQHQRHVRHAATADAGRLSVEHVAALHRRHPQPRRRRRPPRRLQPGRHVVDAADYTVWRNHLNTAAALPNDDTARRRHRRLHPLEEQLRRSRRQRFGCRRPGGCHCSRTNRGVLMAFRFVCYRA